MPPRTRASARAPPRRHPAAAPRQTTLQHHPSQTSLQRQPPRDLCFHASSPSPLSPARAASDCASASAAWLLTLPRQLPQLRALSAFRLRPRFRVSHLLASLAHHPSQPLHRPAPRPPPSAQPPPQDARRPAPIPRGPRANGPTLTTNTKAARPSTPPSASSLQVHTLFACTRSSHASSPNSSP